MEKNSNHRCRTHTPLPLPKKKTTRSDVRDHGLMKAEESVGIERTFFGFVVDARQRFLHALGGVHQLGADIVQRLYAGCGLRLRICREEVLFVGVQSGELLRAPEGRTRKKLQAPQPDNTFWDAKKNPSPQKRKKIERGRGGRLWGRHAFSPSMLARACALLGRSLCCVCVFVP